MSLSHGFQKQQLLMSEYEAYLLSLICSIITQINEVELKRLLNQVSDRTQAKTNIKVDCFF